ncbi:MAG: fatty acid desaturase [Myxococcales bacterium]|nr:fatty acid desaturase [Myxococcales bacterium]
MFRHHVDFISLVLVVFVAMLQGYLAVWQTHAALALPIIIIGARFVTLVQHNHAHLPVFRLRLANDVFGYICTLVSGFPSEAFKIHHFNHHANSDRPQEGKRRDWSSPYAFRRSSFPNKPVSKAYYVLTFPLIAWCETLLYFTRYGSIRQRTDFLISLIVVGVPTAVLAMMLPLSFLTCYLIPWMVVLAGAGWSNYDHHVPYNRSGANDDYRLFGTRLGFNIGYHVEHHLHPRLHWSKLPVSTSSRNAKESDYEATPSRPSEN